MYKGQIEDLIAKKITQFYAKNFKTGPSQTRVYLIEDMIIIRLKIHLSPLERCLLSKKNGVELIKNIRSAIHELTIPQVSQIIEEITSFKPVSSHSDISTKTGEIFQVYEFTTNLEKNFERPPR
jgi:uncharacterized protein YbcI